MKALPGPSQNAQLLWIGGIAVLALAVGIVAALRPDVAASALIGLVLLCALIWLWTLPDTWWWRLWLILLGLGAFGTALDSLTGYPINWLLGLVVLGLFSFSQLRRFASGAQRSSPTYPDRSVLILGASFLLYCLYLFIQPFRADNEPVNAAASLRAPLTGVAAYFLTIHIFRRNMEREQIVIFVEHFLKLIALIAIPIALYSLFQYFVGLDRLSAWGLAGTEHIHHQRNLNGGSPLFRVFGTFRRNEVLGAFMIISIIVNVTAMRLTLHPRAIYLVSLLLSLVAMALSLSLTAIVTAGVWTILIAVVSGSKRLIRFALGVGIVVMALVIVLNYLLDGLILIRVEEHFLDASQGIGRLQVLKNWLTELYHRPLSQLLFGTGICTGLDQATAARIANVLGRMGLNVGELFQCGWQRNIQDNWYATHSLEVGMIGLLLFWATFVFIPIYIVPKLRRAWVGREREAWVILALGILAFWPSGFVGALILYMPINLYFWSLVALLDILIVAPDRSRPVTVSPVAG